MKNSDLSVKINERIVQSARSAKQAEYDSALAIKMNGEKDGWETSVLR